MLRPEEIYYTSSSQTETVHYQNGAKRLHGDYNVKKMWKSSGYIQQLLNVAFHQGVSLPRVGIWYILLERKKLQKLSALPCKMVIFLGFFEDFFNNTRVPLLVMEHPITYIIQIWWLRSLHSDFLHKLAQWVY